MFIASSALFRAALSTDSAKHRPWKAAANCHLRLDLQSFLPSFAIIDTARESDAKRAREICAGVRDGEIVIFDKAYVDFGHLWDSDQRGIVWVTRAKENLQFEIVESLPVPERGKLVAEELVGLKNADSLGKYPEVMRRATAWVEVDGRQQLMTFLTNQLSWSPETIIELYRCRWQIEVFFTQMKQTLQLGDFIGTSANAVRWHVWLGFLVYLLLRYMPNLSCWGHSFSRLFGIVRFSLWSKWHLLSLWQSYGTGGGHFGYLCQPERADLPGFGCDAAGQPVKLA